MYFFFYLTLWILKFIGRTPFLLINVMAQLLTRLVSNVSIYLSVHFHVRSLIDLQIVSEFSPVCQLKPNKLAIKVPFHSLSKINSFLLGFVLA